MKLIHIDQQSEQSKKRVEHLIESYNNSKHSEVQKSIIPKEVPMEKSKVKYIINFPAKISQFYFDRKINMNIHKDFGLKLNIYQ